MLVCLLFTKTFTYFETNKETHVLHHLTYARKPRQGSSTPALRLRARCAISRLTTFNNQAYMSNDAPAVRESRTGILTGPESILKQGIRHDIYAAECKEATI